MRQIRPLCLAVALSGFSACQSTPPTNATQVSPFRPPLDARQGIALFLAPSFARDGVGRPELKILSQDRPVRPQSLTAQVRFPVKSEISSPQAQRRMQVYRCFTVSTQIDRANPAVVSVQGRGHLVDG